DDLNRQSDSGSQAAPGRAGRPRKIEGSTVIERCAQEWATQGEVDCPVEPGVLDYRQTLVVIHDQYGVKTCQHLGHERRVGRQWAARLDAALAHEVDCRRNDLDLLISKVSAFTRVWIQTAH